MEDLRVKGRFISRLYGPDGEIKNEHIGSNVVCTNGKEWLASFLSSAAAAASTMTARYIAIGTGTTPPTASDTAMSTEVGRSTGTASYISGQIYQVTASLNTNSGTGAITEFGVFTSNTAGTLIAHNTAAAVNKGVNDTLTVIWQMTLS